MKKSRNGNKWLWGIFLYLSFNDLEIIFPFLCTRNAHFLRTISFKMYRYDRITNQRWKKKKLAWTLGQRNESFREKSDTKTKKKYEQKRFCMAEKCAIRGFQQIDGTTETTSIITITTNDNNKTHTHKHTAQQQIQSFECYALGIKKERKKHVKKIVAAKPSMCFGSVRKSTTIFEQINKMPVEKQRQITIACFRFIFLSLLLALTIHIARFILSLSHSFLACFFFFF